MKAKRSSEKRAQQERGHGRPKNSGDLIFTPMQKVRRVVDFAIALRRTKNSVASRKLKEGLSEDLFYGTDAFRLLNAAAENSSNDLASELADPARAVIDAISQMAWFAHEIADHSKHEDSRKAAARVSEQVDFALALILRELIPHVRVAAIYTKNQDLLCGVLGILIGDGHEAAKLIKRYQELFPGDDCKEDGTVERESFPHGFASDAFLRVAALEKLVDQWPKHIATAAREMNAWPMLRYCHSDRKKKFEDIVKLVELGADYPLDVSKRPAWRPDTPIVRYVDCLVFNFNAMGHHWRSLTTRGIDKTKAAQEAAKGFGEGAPSVETLKVLIDTLDLPRLTKETSELWANRAIVPYVMATDAKTSDSCGEPALQAIWNQRGVKSAAIFESRLTPRVVRTLKSMARL